MIMKKILFAMFAALVAGNIQISAQERSLRDRLETHVYTLADDSMAGRKAGSPEGVKAAQYIADRFREAGVEPMAGDGGYMQAFQPGIMFGEGKQTFSNVVGIIRSAHPELGSEYILVGAHYDHLGVKGKEGSEVVYNGADDNASGVAALMELGRLLVQSKDRLGRSVILVAFDGEELGMIGSSYFVNHPTVALDDITLMMSVDMVGWLKDGVLTYYGTGTINHSGRALQGGALVPDGLKIHARRFENNILAATDTEPFAVKGIPTLHLTTGVRSPYHSPQDDAELIDYGGLVLITDHLSRVVLSLSAEENLDGSGRRSFKHRNYDRRFEGGVTVVGGMNSLRYSSGPNRGKVSASYGAGVFGQFNMGWLAIRPEALYERNGARYTHGTIWTNSVTLPVSLMIQSPRKYVGGAYLALGGYYRHAFSGSMGYEHFDFNRDYNRNEAGIQWGLGFWLYRISIGVNFRYGMTDLLDNDAYDGGAPWEPNIRNRSTQFTVSYRF